MRSEIEKHNDSLVIWELLGGLIIFLFVTGLPVILWYVFKTIEFIKSENFKSFIMGFSFLPLWIFLFLKIHKIISKKKAKNKMENNLSI